MKFYTHRERKRRRAVAGIIASVIMFSMLFTTGTAYFLFVNNQNQAYNQSLVNRGNALQDRLNELFTISTQLSGTNTLAFTLMNTGNVPISVASVLVMDSSGNVLCLYPNPSARSPCTTNTTPALGGAVNPGVTSVVFDTSYSYVSPNSYSLRVVTSRGNGQTQYYPPVVPNYVLQAQSSGSVTVDMSTFKYIKIFVAGPSTQSFTTCSGSNTCSASFTSKNVAGDILAFALGWYDQTVPAISDTLSDTYTLGVSSTVGQGINPSLVQTIRSQPSPCSTCSLAYTSSVSSGNVLALGVGWSNQNAPSVSDSRGDSFALGVSNSLSSSTAPSLVQKAYTNTASCSSLCQVSYSSSVTAGNLLVFAVGWTSSVIPTISDTRGDSYTLGVSNSFSGTNSYIWYAIAASSGLNTVTANFASSVGAAMSAYELSGASVGGIRTSTGPGDTSNNPFVTSFTPVPNSFVIANVGVSSASSFTAGSGYTLVQSVGQGCNQNQLGCSEFATIASGSTSGSMTLSCVCGGGGPNWADSAIAFPPSTYYSYIWYTTALSSGLDTITATFSGTTTASMAAYEINGVATTGTASSIGSSGGSTSLSVASFTPTSNSFVVGNAETASSSSQFTAGSGYTLPGTCSLVFGCGEYQAVVSSATTVPMTIGSAALWVESAIAFPQASHTLYSYIWYTTTTTSGIATITATFSASATVTASASAYDLPNTSTTGIATSTGSSLTGSTSLSTAPYTPSAGSFVIANAETSSTASKFTAGGFYTLVSTPCNTVGYSGCSEFQQGMSSADTAPMTIATAASWVETVMAFPPITPNTQTGALVNGYPAVSVPACFDNEDHNHCGTGQPIAFRIAFTNRDPQGRTVTLWPGSAMSVGTVVSAIDDDSVTSPFYIVDGLNSAAYPTGVKSYNSTQNFVQLAPNVAVTLYFAATQQLGTTVNVINSQSGVPYEALFTLTGQFSDKSLYGQTIPFPAGVVTASTATLSSLSGGNGASITITTPLCSSVSQNCFLRSRIGVVGWLDSTSKVTVLKTFTTDGSGNVNSVTFTIPTATAGWYTVMISDYVNSYFVTFNHT